MRKLLRLVLYAIQISLPPDRGNPHHRFNAPWNYCQWCQSWNVSYGHFGKSVLSECGPLCRSACSCACIHICVHVYGGQRSNVRELPAATHVASDFFKFLHWPGACQFVWAGDSDTVTVSPRNPRNSTSLAPGSQMVLPHPAFYMRSGDPMGHYACIANTLSIEPSLQSADLTKLWIDISGKTNIVVHLKP